MKKLMYLFLISSLMYGGFCLIVKIQAKQDYLGYLKRAADANSIELAKTELAKAITEIERRELTSGNTRIIYKTPDQDIEFWYLNLKTSLKELSDLPENSSSLEKSNMLLKLRETLLDSDKEGDKVTFPKGISLYPNNRPIAIWGILSIIGTIIFFVKAGEKNNWFD